MVNESLLFLQWALFLFVRIIVVHLINQKIKAMFLTDPILVFQIVIGLPQPIDVIVLN
jgi:hypothetical protein